MTSALPGPMSHSISLFSSSKARAPNEWVNRIPTTHGYLCVSLRTHFEWVQKSGYPRGQLHYPGTLFTHTQSFTHGYTQSLQRKTVLKALKGADSANSAHLLNFVYY